VGYKVTDWLHLQLQAEVPVSERDNGEAVHFGIISPLYTSPKNELTVDAGDSHAVQRKTSPGEVAGGRGGGVGPL